MAWNLDDINWSPFSSANKIWWLQGFYYAEYFLVSRWIVKPNLISDQNYAKIYHNSIDLIGYIRFYCHELKLE